MTPCRAGPRRQLERVGGVDLPGPSRARGSRRTPPAGSRCTIAYSCMRMRSPTAMPERAAAPPLAGDGDDDRELEHRHLAQVATRSPRRCRALRIRYPGRPPACRRTRESAAELLRQLHHPQRLAVALGPPRGRSCARPRLVSPPLPLSSPITAAALPGSRARPVTMAGSSEKRAVTADLDAFRHQALGRSRAPSAAARRAPPPAPAAGGRGVDARPHLLEPSDPRLDQGGASRSGAPAPSRRRRHPRLSPFGGSSNGPSNSESECLQTMDGTGHCCGLTEPGPAGCSTSEPSAPTAHADLPLTSAVTRTFRCPAPLDDEGDSAIRPLCCSEHVSQPLDVRGRCSRARQPDRHQLSPAARGTSVDQPNLRRQFHRFVVALDLPLDQRCRRSPAGGMLLEHFPGTPPPRCCRQHPAA